MKHRKTYGVPKDNLVGKRFGRLIVVAMQSRELHTARESAWVCKCDCGGTKTASLTHLKKGYTKSCGCLQKESKLKANRTHGMSRSKEYNSYLGAKARCNNPKNPNYKNYGGRGIEFKLNSFEEFFEELGHMPKGKSLDRKNNDGHYELGNLRWSTSKEQADNTRRKRIENFTNQELLKEIRKRGLSL